MKNLPIFFLLFLGYSSFGQDGLLPLDEHKQVLYTDRGRIEKSKEEIFQTAERWLAKTFAHYENVSPPNRETGTLSINTYIPVSHSLYDYVRMDLTIGCLDHQYEAKINKLDATSPVRTPIRLSAKDNDELVQRSVAIKTENNRKKREEAEQAFETAKADNNAVNDAVYRVLASLKEFMNSEK